MRAWKPMLGWTAVFVLVPAGMWLAAIDLWPALVTALTLVIFVWLGYAAGRSDESKDWRGDES